jgi:two-component system sensor histidine kinase ChiS
MSKPVILCIDDERIILTSLKEQLRRRFQSQYLIETVESGEEALEILEEFMEDAIDMPVVIADQIMPGMKGDELLREIHTVSPKTLKIMLTGPANADPVGNAVNFANLYRYISKPWEENDLAMTVTEALRCFYQDKKLEEQNTALQQMNHDLEQLNHAYERFVPRQFLGFLEKRSIVDVQLGDQVQKEMSILFSDIRGFTPLSETMTPEENFQFLNSYLSQMEPVILEHDGFIDKYIGDGIMALFPKTADNAVGGAIAMMKQLAAYNSQRRQVEPIRIGIGVNSGSLMLGTIGGNNRMDSTVIADTVNLASRLEGLTKRYKANILISAYTLAALSDPEKYNCRFLGKVQVKGKQAAVPIYEVYDGDPDDIIELKHKTRSVFEEGLQNYFAKEFITAMGFFTQVLASNPNDKTAQLYVERCARFISQGVPDDWEGVEIMDTK